MKSKTTIGRQVGNKTNKELVDTIIAAKKRSEWLKIAGILSGSRRQSINLNLSEINDKSQEGDTLLIPGKVLSQGEIKKKVKIIAYKFSEKAKERLLKEKIQMSSIMDEIKKNPEAKGIKVLTR